MPEYPVVSRNESIKAFQAVQTAVSLPADISHFTTKRASARPFPQAEVGLAVESVLALTDSEEWKAGPGGREDEFEAQASEVAFPHLDALGVEALSDRDFWCWLAIGPFQELVLWRYDFSRQKSSAWMDYWFGAGGSLPHRCFPYSIYLRSVLVNACTDDPLERQKLLHVYSVDLWQSHLFAVRTSSSPGLVRAILEGALADRFDHADLDRNDVIKAVGKGVTSLRSNIVTEVLGETGCKRIFDMAVERV